MELEGWQNFCMEIEGGELYGNWLVPSAWCLIIMEIEGEPFTWNLFRPLPPPTKAATMTPLLSSTLLTSGETSGSSAPTTSTHRTKRQLSQIKYIYAIIKHF